jgi:hypothetical protein
MRSNRRASIGADRDQWTKAAFDACLVPIRDLVGVDGLIRPETPIGRLTGPEWAWFISAAISAWVRTRSEQASVEGWNHERTCHTTGLEPDPWVQGAVASVLPMLADTCPTLDWSKPVGEWSNDGVVAFLIAGFNLIRHALAARDAAENPASAGGSDPSVLARTPNGAPGNPLMTANEFRQLREDFQ